MWLGKGKAKPVTTEAVEVSSIAPSIAEPAPVSADEPITPLAANPTPLPAAVIPASPQPEIPAEITDHEVTLTLGDRRYRIRGLEKNLGL